MTMKLPRAFVPAIACLGASLVLFSVAPAFAQEEEDDTSDMSFEQSIIHQLMTGIGAVNGRNSKGINYRERSPLVLPPSADLPTPQAGAARAPNWPKDPDEMERAAAAAAAKAPRQSYEDARRPLMPSELAKGKKRQTTTAADQQPGQQRDAGRALLPSELGYKGGLFGNILTPGKEETAVFTAEPPREALTAPPAGYQTPSPNYAYGIGANSQPAKQERDPGRPLPPGKY